MPVGRTRAGGIQVGAKIGGGRYELVAKLGEGGFGTVYKARELGSQAVGRELVCKVISRERLQPQARYADYCRRFAVEAKILLRMTHPNVVEALSFGEHDGEPFLMMEYLHGKTLAEAIDAAEQARTPIEVGRLKSWALQLGRGLCAIHSHRGVLHRDIKAENIMLQVKPAGELLKILDFGVALDPDTRLTGDGEALGTPMYQAPEAFLRDDFNRPLALDGRADLFAVGVVLYKAATFRYPFASPQAAADVTQRPWPPSGFRGLPAALDHIILRLLQKDRAERYTDAEAFCRAVEAFDPSQPCIQTSAPLQPASRVSTADLLPCISAISADPLQLEAPSPEHAAALSGPHALPTWAQIMQRLPEAPPSKAPKAPHKRIRKRDQTKLYVLAFAALFIFIAAWRAWSERPSRQGSVPPARHSLAVTPDSMFKPPHAVTAQDLLHGPEAERSVLKTSLHGEQREKASAPEATRLPPAKAVRAKAKPAPAASPPAFVHRRLSREDMVHEARGLETDVVPPSPRQTLGIATATLAEATLQQPLSSAREGMVVARLTRGVRSGAKQPVAPGALAVGRATYQERGGVWYVNIRFTKLISGPGGEEYPISAIATQQGEGGLKGVVAQNDHRTLANVGLGIVRTIERGTRQVSGSDTMEPFTDDKADDLRALRRGGVVVHLPRGLTFEIQFEQAA